MVIKTKFNVGDIVWTIDPNTYKAIFFCIDHIKIEIHNKTDSHVSTSNPSILYCREEPSLMDRLSSHPSLLSKNFGFEESLCFSSLDDLLLYVIGKNDYIDLSFDKELEGAVFSDDLDKELDELNMNNKLFQIPGSAGDDFYGD